MENVAIDFAPLADMAIQSLAIMLMALGTVFTAWIGKKVKDKFGLDIEDKHRKVLQDTLNYGIMYGAKKAKSLARDHANIDVKTSALSLAGAYVAKAVPDALKQFKIDPETDEGRAKILDLVESRFEDWLLDGEDVQVDLPPMADPVNGPNVPGAGSA